MSDELTVAQMLKGVNYTTKRKIQRCTVEYTLICGTRKIRFWRTDIITFLPNGNAKITLNGYWTPTTIARVNRHFGRGYLHRRNGKGMYFCLSNQKDYIFEEGMTVDKNGVPYNMEPYNPKPKSKLNSVW